MPLIKNGKKKDKKSLKDRFMRQALGAKFPGAKSSDMLEFEFTQTFSEKKLEAIGKKTDRLLLGRGQFDQPYQRSKQITRKYARYISGVDDPSDDVTQEMLVEFEALKVEAQSWLESSEAKWSNKDESKKDSITQVKEIAARGMLSGAKVAIFQINNRRMLEDPALGRLMTNLESARDKATADDRTPKDVEAYRSLDAEILAQVCGSSKPDSGTSDVALLEGADGEVAYAFKSVAGESEMMGTPKGFAACREVLMSTLMDNLNSKHQLGFGWPKVTMASVGGKPGALIDGVQGMKVGGSGLAMEEVPAETLQKILLCNLMGGQFDIKWEDVRLVRNGDTLEPVCMDGGAAMPDPETATTFLHGMSDGKPGQQIIYNGDPSTDGILPEAKKKLGKDLVDKIRSIDALALRKELEAEARRLETDHGLGVKTHGLDTGVKTAMDSIAVIQEILRQAGGDISLEKLLAQFHERMIEGKLVAPHREAWNQAQLDAYARLRLAHPGLFVPADGHKSVPDMFRAVLHPQELAKLGELVELAKPGTVVDLMNRYELGMPVTEIASILTKVKLMMGEIQAGLKVYDTLVRKWPGLIVDKSSFATPEAAWAAVVGQKLALDSLAAIASDPAQNDGQVLTVIELLQRHGYTVPTSGFKDKLAAIRLAIQKPASDQAQTS